MEFPITCHNSLKVNQAVFNLNCEIMGFLKEFDFNLNCFGKIYLPKFSLCGISCNAESKEYRANKVYMFVYKYPLAVLVFYPLQLTVWNMKSFGAPNTIRKLLNEKHTSLSSVCVYINICWTDTWPPRKHFTGRCHSEFWILIFSFTFEKKTIFIIVCMVIIPLLYI